MIVVGRTHHNDLDHYVMYLFLNIIMFLCFYFKYIHKQLPPFLLNWPIIPSVSIHNYNTRVKDNIQTFRTKHEFAMKCLRYSLPHFAWLYMLCKICLLNNYSDMCTLLNCYTCQLNQ